MCTQTPTSYYRGFTLWYADAYQSPDGKKGWYVTAWPAQRFDLLRDAHAMIDSETDDG